MAQAGTDGGDASEFSPSRIPVLSDERRCFELIFFVCRLQVQAEIQTVSEFPGGVKPTQCLVAMYFALCSCLGNGKEGGGREEMWLEA